MTTTAVATYTVNRDDAQGVVELRLANGMLVLLLAQPDSPIVSTQTWYRVGSREEEKGKTGLAHFLEHLLFKGTEVMRKGDIDIVTLRNGGQNNADTTYDRTRYYFQFAKDRWERAIEIEADRMRGSAFNEHEFRLERGPVLEELRRDHDDPWWRLSETMDATAYQSHPYHNPVIGWPDEVTVVPREDVLRFYERWYQPGNCTLVVVGGIDVDQAIARIVELFGAIPGGPVPELRVPQEPLQEGERRFELEMEVQVPRMLAAFHTCRAKDAEDPVLDVIQTILSSGKSSRLYSKMVRKSALAREVSAWNDTRRDPGLFMVMMELNEDVEPAKAEAVLWREIDRLAKNGPTKTELRRAQQMVSASMIYRRATASGMAELIGGMQVHSGDWRMYAEVERRITAVTAEDVKRVMAQFIRRANRSVGWALPRPEGSPPRPELPGDEIHTDIGPPPVEGRTEPEICRRVPTRVAGTVELPAKRITLPNGLRVLLLRRGSAPVISVRSYVDGGMLREATPGVASLAGECLDEAAGGRTGAEISSAIEARGAILSAGAVGVAIRSLVRDFRPCLQTMADVLRAPEFRAQDVEKKRAHLISELMAENDDPAQTGRTRLRKEIYGAHPYSRRDKGSAETLRALTREQVVAHHKALFVPRNTILACVGQLPVDAMEEAIVKAFGDWEDREPPARNVAEPHLPTAEEAAQSAAARNIALREDRDQVHIFLGHLGFRRTEPDYHTLLVGDLVLGSGSGFTDRLSKKLRDEMGLAYSVSARIARSADLEPGTFSAYIGTSPQSKDIAKETMIAEIRRFVDDGPTASEVEDAKNFLLGSYVFGFETVDATAEYLVHLERLGLPLDEPAAFARRIAAVTADEVAAAAKRHIFPDRLISVMVGRV